MRLATIRIQNFRCFGPNLTSINLGGEITALVGANGSGKTALLMALSRMFGVSQSQRTVTRSDFHVPPGTSPDDRRDRDLSIEALIEFPELKSDNQAIDSIPPTFNHMIVTAPGESPVCRIRLEAKWTDDGTAEGDIEQRQYWILTDDQDPDDTAKVRLSPFDRALTQVFYVPADRDPSHELRYAARTGLGRLVRAISWSDETRRAIREASGAIRETLDSEQGITLVADALQRRWGSLADEYAANEVSLIFADTDLERLVSEFGVAFFPGDDGRESELSGLSDGQQSLFYLALLGAISDIEALLVRDTGLVSGPADTSDDEGTTPTDEEDPLAPSGFRTDRLPIPALTVLAVEEPENHLAPHYLARIISLLRDITGTGRTQAVFSSHSPAALRRVEPQEVRYFRLNTEAGTSKARAITLPDTTEEAAKYVREAIVAYPELYFAKFVILAEGPSEEIALPRVALARGLHIDQSFVSVVPLGGRHVNHFWRLLTDLGIPHATLLDLDAGRKTGGWARIKYVCGQLLQNGHGAADLLIFNHEGTRHTLTEDQLDALHERAPETVDELVPWCRHLEKFGVYFSGPLDFDLAMLRRFSDAYQGLSDQSGPQFPGLDSGNRERYTLTAIRSALGNDESVDLYVGTQWEDLFPWYRYLFSSRSKPAIHLEALSVLDGERLADDAPPSIIRLLEECEDTITTDLGAGRQGAADPA